MTLSTGNITTIAGNGTAGYSGDKGPATGAEIAAPFDVALGVDCVYIAEFFGNRIRKVTVSTGIITTIAGTGAGGCNGDNILATKAQISQPTAVATDGMGDVYFSDFSNARVRKVTLSTGNITTIAGMAPQDTMEITSWLLKLKLVHLLVLLLTKWEMFTFATFPTVVSGK